MKVTSSSRGVEERNAYCTQCDWSRDGITADKKARYHASETGHQVDVYTETRRRVKPVKKLAGRTE